MTTLRHNKEPVWPSARKTQWLAVLEQELKSRVGWVDEAISPFAGRSGPALAPSKIQRDVLRGEKAA
jgi:hypothetical protein